MYQVESADEDPHPDPALQILHFSSYDDVEPYWDELSRSYKNGELVLDRTARKLVWEHFYRPRRYELAITVILEHGRCAGIFPFLRPPAGEPAPRVWDHCDDMLLAQEYFCPPDRIAELAPYLPPHSADDMSCFYRPPDRGAFAEGTGTVIEILDSREAYLSSLSHSHRQSLRRTLQANQDLRVEADDHVRSREIGPIRRMQLEYWRSRTAGGDPSLFRYSRDKIKTDLKLMKRAEEMGRLVALYIYAGQELVAANFAVRREHDRVDDYLCLRNSQPVHQSRGLGIFAILANLDHCRSLGIRYYDLSSSRAEYKRKFINADHRFVYLSYPVLEEPQPEPRPAPEPLPVPARRRRARARTAAAAAYGA